MWMVLFNGNWICLEEDNALIEEAYCDPSVDTFFVKDALPVG